MTIRLRKVGMTFMVALIITVSGCATAPKPKAGGAATETEDSQPQGNRMRLFMFSA